MDMNSVSWIFLAELGEFVYSAMQNAGSSLNSVFGHGQQCRQSREAYRIALFDRQALVVGEVAG